MSEPTSFRLPAEAEKALKDLMGRTGKKRSQVVADLLIDAARRDALIALTDRMDAVEERLGKLEEKSRP